MRWEKVDSTTRKNVVYDDDEVAASLNKVVFDVVVYKISYCAAA